MNEAKMLKLLTSQQQQSLGCGVDVNNSLTFWGLMLIREGLALFLKMKMETENRRPISDMIASVRDDDNRALLSKWVVDKRGFQPDYIRNYTYRSVRILNDLGKSWKLATEQDIQDYIDRCRPGKYGRVWLRSLFRYAYGMEGTGGVPDVVKHVSTKRMVNERIMQRVFDISREELMRLLDCAGLRDRTMLSILADSPTRPKDLCNMNVGDVRLDKFGAEVFMHSKTEHGQRWVRLLNSAPSFLEYYSQHPGRGDTSNPMFYNRIGNDFVRLTTQTMQRVLMRLEKKAKLTRHIRLYDFRRTVTSNMCSDPHYPAKVVQKLGGWSSLQMLDIYGRVKDKEANDVRLKSVGKLGDGGEKLIDIAVCPRCKQENSMSAVACSNCWLPLKRGFGEVEHEVQERMAEKQTPFAKEAVKALVKEMLENGEIDLKKLGL